MNIAELFVRVRADVTDVNRRMRDIEGALGGVDRASKSAGLSTGRLGNQFANLAGRIAHVHPVVGNLASVLGNFAIGAGLTVGVLAGVAAVAVAYDKLTDSSRKAMGAGDRLAETYNKLARISALGIGGQIKADIEDMNKGLEQHNKWLGFIIAARVQLGSLGGFLGGQQKKQSDAITALTTGLASAEKEKADAITAAKEKAAAKAKDAADKLAAAMKKAAEFAEKYAMYMYEAGKWTANISGQTLAGLTLADAEKRLGLERGQFKMGIPDADMPGIAMPFENLDKRQKEQLRQLGILTDKADENARMIQGAVLQSAQIIGSAVMQALNVGGGGRGSQIGGMIGAGVGGVLGSALGPPGSVIASGLGSVLGSVVGGLAGSLFGGLFDNKKEVNANTLALRQNTAALLQNGPSVYKVARGRFDATEVKEFRRSTIRYATRGGAPVMVVP